MQMNSFYYKLTARYPDVHLAFFDDIETMTTIVRMISSKHHIAQGAIPSILTDDNFKEAVEICNDLYAKIKTADLING